MSCISSELLYKRYVSSRRRCIDTKSKDYPYYWGRWILFEWDNYYNFKNDMLESFLLHIEEHWLKNTTLDRINSNWNYCKDNCRWATRKVQGNNSSQVQYINVWWERLSMMEVSEKYNIDYYYLRYHITYAPRNNYWLDICNTPEFWLLFAIRHWMWKCLICDSECNCKWLCKKHYRYYYYNWRDRLDTLKKSINKNLWK